MMSQIQQWLAGGDLTSDGEANQVADLVIENLILLDELIDGLKSENDIVRGHAADALEKVARRHPEAVALNLPLLLQSAENDPVPMVRWHLAMVLGHLSMDAAIVETIVPVLLTMLADTSVFTQSWVIVSLCIIARQYPDLNEKIAPAIAGLGNYPSKAIQAKVRYALPILTNPQTPFPKGWIKSEHLQHLYSS